MNAYWVTFEVAKPGCVEAVDEEAAAAFAQDLVGEAAVTVSLLIFPAEPRLNVEIRDDKVVPSLCKTPAKCAAAAKCQAKPRCRLPT